MTLEGDALTVSRGTKCLAAYNGGELPGAFPGGFMKWVKAAGWWGSERCYLCAGVVKDKEAFRVDIKPQMKPDLVADAIATGLPPEQFDWIMIDPPYTRNLAEELYGTGKYYHTINAFTKEANRLLKPGGLILTLSYEIPKRPKRCQLVACWGIYTVPQTSHMRCFTVWLKPLGNRPWPPNN